MTRLRLAAALAAGLAGLASAQPGDPLAEARARQSLADQKASAEVQTALQDADRLARTNPARAAQILKTVQNGIDLSAAISPEARRALTTQLQARLAAIEGRPAPAPAARPDPAAPGVKADRKAAFEAMQAELKEVREGIDVVARFREQNKFAEADTAAAALARKYPTNPAVLALTQKDATANAVAESRAFADMQSKRLVAAQNNLIASSLPAKGDIEFPADWATRAGRRTNEQKLTTKERELLAALDRPVTLAIKDQPLEYALQELSDKLGQRLLVDQKSLRDLDIDLKKTTSLDARGLSARTALRQVLAANGLTFVVKDEAIQVVTVERSRDLLVTRVYYLGDLIQGVGPFGGALQWGPLLDFQQTEANAKMIIDAIKSSVDPMSWEGKGGSGTVSFHFPSMSLIVRASSEVHASLGSRLR